MSSPPPPPPPHGKLSRLAYLLLFIVSQLQAEIHQLFQGRACTNTILAKL